jgi:hypothetical protein
MPEAPNGSTQPTPDAGGATAQDHSAAITPELVRQVADRVYMSLMEELRIERERSTRWREKTYARR